MNKLARQIIQEIALEGLQGCSFQTLFNRLKQDNVILEDGKIKEIIWKIIIQSPEINFYKIVHDESNTTTNINNDNITTSTLSLPSSSSSSSLPSLPSTLPSSLPSSSNTNNQKKDIDDDDDIDNDDIDEGHKINERESSVKKKTAKKSSKNCKTPTSSTSKDDKNCGKSNNLSNFTKDGYLDSRVRRDFLDKKIVQESLDIDIVENDSNIILVAHKTIRANLLGLTSNDTPISEVQYCMLEYIGRGRKNGVLQSDFGKEMNIDPRSTLYHLKKFQTLDLIYRNQVYVPSIKTTTNLVHLKMFAESKMLQNEGVQLYKETQQLKEDVVSKTLDTLKEAKDHMLIESEVKKNLGFQEATDKRMWEKFRNAILKTGRVQRFLADIQGKKYWVLKLIKNEQGNQTFGDHSTNEDIGFFVETPAIFQFYHRIEKSGAKGITHPEIFRHFQADHKFSTCICNELREKYGVKRVAETQNKQTLYRYTIPSARQSQSSSLCLTEKVTTFELEKQNIGTNNSITQEQNTSNDLEQVEQLVSSSNIQQLNNDDKNKEENMIDPDTPKSEKINAPLKKKSGRKAVMTKQHEDRCRHAMDLMEEKKIITRLQLRSYLIEKLLGGDKSKLETKTLSRLIQYLENQKLVKTFTITIPTISGLNKEHTCIMQYKYNNDDQVVQDFIISLKRNVLSSGTRGITQTETTKLESIDHIHSPLLPSQTVQRYRESHHAGITTRENQEIDVKTFHISINADMNDKINKKKYSHGIAIYYMTLNGYIHAKMLRIKLFHQYLLECALSNRNLSNTGEVKPDTITLHLRDIMENLPMSLYLKILGVQRDIDCTEYLEMRSNTKFSELEPDFKKLILANKSYNFPNTKIGGMLQILEKLQLIKPVKDIKNNDQQSIEFSSNSTQDYNSIEFFVHVKLLENIFPSNRVYDLTRNWNEYWEDLHFLCTSGGLPDPVNAEENCNEIRLNQNVEHLICEKIPELKESNWQETRFFTIHQLRTLENLLRASEKPDPIVCIETARKLRIAIEHVILYFLRYRKVVLRQRLNTGDVNSGQLSINDNILKQFRSVGRNKNENKRRRRITGKKRKIKGKQTSSSSQVYKKKRVAQTRRKVNEMRDFVVSDSETDSTMYDDSDSEETSENSDQSGSNTENENEQTDEKIFSHHTDTGFEDVFATIDARRKELVNNNEEDDRPQSLSQYVSRRLGSLHGSDQASMSQFKSMSGKTLFGEGVGDEKSLSDADDDDDDDDKSANGEENEEETMSDSELQDTVSQPRDIIANELDESNKSKRMKDEWKGSFRKHAQRKKKKHKPEPSRKWNIEDDLLLLHNLSKQRRFGEDGKLITKPISWQPIALLLNRNPDACRRRWMVLMKNSWCKHAVELAIAQRQLFETERAGEITDKQQQEEDGKIMEIIKRCHQNHAVVRLSTMNKEKGSKSLLVDQNAVNDVTSISQQLAALNVYNRMQIPPLPEKVTLFHKYFTVLFTKIKLGNESESLQKHNKEECFNGIDTALSHFLRIIFLTPEEDYVPQIAQQLLKNFPAVESSQCFSRLRTEGVLTKCKQRSIRLRGYQVTAKFIESFLPKHYPVGIFEDIAKFRDRLLNRKPKSELEEEDEEEEYAQPVRKAITLMKPRSRIESYVALLGGDNEEEEETIDVELIFNQLCTGGDIAVMLSLLSTESIQLDAQLPVEEFAEAFNIPANISHNISHNIEVGDNDDNIAREHLHPNRVGVASHLLNTGVARESNQDEELLGYTFRNIQLPDWDIRIHNKIDNNLHTNMGREEPVILPRNDILHRSCIETDIENSQKDKQPQDNTPRKRGRDYDFETSHEDAAEKVVRSSKRQRTATSSPKHNISPINTYLPTPTWKKPLPLDVTTCSEIEYDTSDDEEDKEIEGNIVRFTEFDETWDSLIESLLKIEEAETQSSPHGDEITSTTTVAAPIVNTEKECPKNYERLKLLMRCVCKSAQTENIGESSVRTTLKAMKLLYDSVDDSGKNGISEAQLKLRFFESEYDRASYGSIYETGVTQLLNFECVARIYASDHSRFVSDRHSRIYMICPFETNKDNFTYYVLNRLMATPVAPWKKLNGDPNAQFIQQIRQTLMERITAHPGITQSAILKFYGATLTPQTVKSILDVLELENLIYLRKFKYARPSIFGRGEEMEDYCCYPTIDALVRFNP